MFERQWKWRKTGLSLIYSVTEKGCLFMSNKCVIETLMEKHLVGFQPFLLCQPRLGEVYLNRKSTFPQISAKTPQFNELWRCSGKLFLLACQALSDVLMQVNSQTCSCRERQSRKEGMKRKLRISSSAYFLICSSSQLRSSQTQHSPTQPSFPGILPPTTEIWVCPPIYTSVLSST